MIKRNNMKMTALSMAMGIVLLTGCSTGTTNQTIGSETNGQVGSGSQVQALGTTTEIEGNNIEVSYDEADYYTEWKDEEVTKINLNGSSVTSEGAGVTTNGSVVTINSGGTYVLSGKLEDGQIIVDVQDKQTVRIVLNGVEIHSSTSSPFYVKEAKKAIVSLMANTTNKLSDTAEYVFEDGADEPDATLFSKDDLTINGAGTLVIEANYNNAITSKDELKIMEGNLNISTVGDGIKGKDMVAVKDGIITMDAEEDGIKATNSTDSTKGFIYIEGGTFDITAGNDGFQAETDIKILDGIFKLNTGGGSANGATHTESAQGGFGGQGGVRPDREGMTKPENEGMTPPSGEAMPSPQGGEVSRPTEMPVQGAADTNADSGSTEEILDETTSDSYKGIKANQTMVIEGGTFDIDSADDALHCDDIILINDGTFTLVTGDDGIHADHNLIINGGKIHINKSYEGLEAANIVITGGETYVTSSDDGINAAASTTETTMSTGAPGMNAGTAKLTVSGGYVSVDANGDGLDANGSVEMTGGTVIVNGPANGGNGSLDYDSTFVISGGTLITAGSSQMAQDVSSTSEQKSISMTFSSTQEANSTIAVLDETGNLVMSFSPSKSYQKVSISSPLLEAGKSYSFSYGGTTTGTSVDGLCEEGSYTGGTTVATFEISDTITYLSETGVTTGGAGFGQGGGTKPNGGKGNREAQGTA